MTEDGINKRIAKQIQSCIETLGKEATQEMLDTAKRDDCTPMCCRNCPYHFDCGVIGIVPWLMQCGRYDQYKRTHVIVKSQPDIEQRLDKIEQRLDKVENERD